MTSLADCADEATYARNTLLVFKDDRRAAQILGKTEAQVCAMRTRLPGSQLDRPLNETQTIRARIMRARGKSWFEIAVSLRRPESVCRRAVIA